MADEAKPLVLTIDETDARRTVAAIERAAAVVRGGGLVAMPTETVYGLAANALDVAAVRRIFAAKGRPSFNPLIVHLADPRELSRVVGPLSAMTSATVARLAARFWPGPLTLVLPRGPAVPTEVTAGRDTVAVRVPGHPIARALIAAAGVPLAAPSANAFTRVSPTTAAHVVEQLGGAVDIVLDAGPCAVGIESTVLDLTAEQPVLLRPGAVTRHHIEQQIGPVGDVAQQPSGSAPRPSPGMIERHYAPRATLRGFDAGERAAVWRELQALAARGQRVGLLAFVADGAAATVVRRMPRDVDGYARELYAALHAFDAAACSIAFVERPPADAAWEAIVDRLARAGLGRPPR